MNHHSIKRKNQLKNRKKLRTAGFGNLGKTKNEGLEVHDEKIRRQFEISNDLIISKVIKSSNVKFLASLLISKNLFDLSSIDDDSFSINPHYHQKVIIKGKNLFLMPFVRETFRI